MSASTSPQTPFRPQALNTPPWKMRSWYWFSAEFSQPLARPVQNLPPKVQVGPGRPVSVARPVT